MNQKRACRVVSSIHCQNVFRLFISTSSFSLKKVVNKGGGRFFAVSKWFETNVLRLMFTIKIPPYLPYNEPLSKFDVNKIFGVFNPANYVNVNVTKMLTGVNSGGLLDNCHDSWVKVG